MMFRRISKDRSCPVCKSLDAYRVKRAGFPVKVVCRVLNLRPHWCPDCDTFFLGPRHLNSAGVPELYGPNRGEKKNTNLPHLGGLPR